MAIDPNEVALLDKNPHYMSKRTFDQLTANIKRDGNLSSLPLLWKLEDGQYECLSGNHRVQAARAAGVPLILCLYTDAKLSLSEKRAIQLSHNSLIGKDDPDLLREVWAEIEDLSMKVYSGFDDDAMNALPMAMPIQIKDAGLLMEELRIMFLPAEIDRIDAIMDQLGRSDKRRYAVPLEAWEPFFDTFLGFKEAVGVKNTGAAFLAMIGIVEEWLRARRESIQPSETE